MAGVALQHRVADARHEGLAGQELHHLLRVAMCRAMRSGRVSMPCRISQAVCGLMQAPKSRRPSRRARSRKAPTVLSSVNTMLWKPS
jgi:hypothetical protein